MRLFGKRRGEGPLPAGALNALERPQPSRKLARFTLVDLAAELVARLDRGDAFTSDRDIVLAGQLDDLLDSRLDVHLNRFGRRRYYDLVRPVLDRVSVDGIRDSVVVDLGSGSLNPFAFSFVLLMLGAKRAYAVDLEPVQDPDRAVRALATAAGWMLIDPDRLVGSHAIPPADVLRNLAGFDLARLAHGDAGGIDENRLSYRVESLYDLSLADGEADLVSTVSLLEHLDRIDEAMDVLRRVTRPGGFGHHIVDFVDHRVYGGTVASPFDFLTIDSAEPLVHGSNRIRADEMREIFERHGFDVLEVESCRDEPVPPADRPRFVEPFRSMSDRNLSMLCARFVVRRR